MRKSLSIVLAAAAALACAPAFARGSVHFGFHFGVPVWGGWYPPAYSYYYAPPVYYSPYYYAPPAYIPPVVAAPSAPAMVEQPRSAEPPMWYYCAGTKSYYPYVRECAGGWQRVPATPPPG